MDILRKELNEIYKSQELDKQILSLSELQNVNNFAATISNISKGCSVVTDASSDHCYIFPGSFGVLFGFSDTTGCMMETDSSDEDVIYDLIHPEDLVDKRFLEYEFFKKVNNIKKERKLAFIAKCRIRMRKDKDQYLTIDNTTQIIHLSPNGKIWLILCTYNLSSEEFTCGMSPTIIDTSSGEKISFSFKDCRNEILSKREKEILCLIKDGKSSKMIGAILGISINTVNRHRQNIIEKLSVGNSVEAVTAATLMKLI